MLHFCSNIEVLYRSTHYKGAKPYVQTTLLEFEVCMYICTILAVVVVIVVKETLEHNYSLWNDPDYMYCLVLLQVPWD